MGWKDRFGYWDFKEIAIDMVCISGGVLIIAVLVYYV